MFSWKIMLIFMRLEAILWVVTWLDFSPTEQETKTSILQAFSSR